MQRDVIIVYIMMEMNNMFNVTKALKKLIECSIGDDTKHCNGYVTFAELNAIFESGQSDEVEEKKIKIGGYQELAVRIKNANRRIGDIEAKCGCKVKFKDSVEERLARLEDVMRTHYHDPIDNKSLCISGCNDEPEKPDGLDYLRKAYSECEGKTPEYLMGIEGKTPDFLTGKPSEFIILPRGVAERYIRYVEAKDAPEAIEYYRSRQDVIDAIKQQLG
jgi:hypothetical protein